MWLIVITDMLFAKLNSGKDDTILMRSSHSSLVTSCATSSSVVSGVFYVKYVYCWKNKIHVSEEFCDENFTPF